MSPRVFAPVCVVALAVLAAFAGSPFTAQPTPAAADRTPTSFLCIPPESATVAGHRVGPTPEVCVPFIQWPPVSG